VNYIQGITKEVPTKDRVEQLARSMEVKEQVHELAEVKRPDYGQKERKPVEMEMGRQKTRQVSFSAASGCNVGAASY
jgi:hypothetical protein